MAENLALLLTDVVDSTQLNEQLGDDVMGALWAAHDQAARELMRAWRGKEVGRSDGFLLLFALVSDAVGFAMAYQRALTSLAVPLKARVGVHWGPVALRQNSSRDTAQGATPFEIDGVALPAAARVMSAATGGQTLLSGVALHALGPTPLRTLSHGQWRLKGLTEVIELFEIGDEHAPFTPPPDSAKAYRVVLADGTWKPARELPNNLPAERDIFIGRLEALQALADHLDLGARLVTLLGMGGIGKTRLAQRYARTWLGDYSGGAWFCDLSAARSLDGIVHAVAKGLDVPLGKADPVQQLGAAIAGRGPCLVILDNFEQVARHAEETLGAWLEKAPEAKFIATSREVLGIVGEQAMVLAPLKSDEAVQMFRQRVGAAGAHSAIAVFDPHDEAAVGPLIELLDRLPLAIELAAARARVMSPGLLLQRMGERLTLLTSRGGRHDRQATLRAALDWSWDLLSLQEQSALAQLSVFVGGFKLAAAEQVVDLAATAGSNAVVDVVQALAEKSLIRHQAADRFALLGLVQEYAAEHLCTAGRYPGSGPAALAQAHARHCAFFSALKPADAMADGCADLDNLVAATRRACLSGMGSAAVGALESAWVALKLRGPFRVGVELAALVRAMPGLDVACQARIDRVAGWALKASGRVAEAAACFSAALVAARAAGDRACEGHVVGHLGDLHVNEGRMDIGKIELQSALAIARELGDGGLVCEALAGLGRLSGHLGNLVESRAHYEAALSAARLAGDRRWEGGALGNLGVLCANQGKTEEAQAFYGLALAAARELGDRQWEGNTLCNLGLLHHVQGTQGPAESELNLALAIARELGYVRLECVVLCNLGMVVEAMARPDHAAAHYESALKVARVLGDRRSEGQVLGYLGLLHARQGRFKQGRQLLEVGQSRLEEVADRLHLALLLCSRAQCDALAGDLAAANAAWAEAQSIADQIGAEPGSEIFVSLEKSRAIIGLPSTPIDAAQGLRP